MHSEAGTRHLPWNGHCPDASLQVIAPWLSASGCWPEANTILAAVLHFEAGAVSAAVLFSMLVLERLHAGSHIPVWKPGNYAGGAVCRWQLAKDSVISATAMHREADTVADADMRGKDR